MTLPDLPQMPDLDAFYDTLKKQLDDLPVPKATKVQPLDVPGLPSMPDEKAPKEPSIIPGLVGAWMASQSGDANAVQGVQRAAELVQEDFRARRRQYEMDIRRSWELRYAQLLEERRATRSYNLQAEQVNMTAEQMRRQETMDRAALASQAWTMQVQAHTMEMDYYKAAVDRRTLEPQIAALVAQAMQAKAQAMYSFSEAMGNFAAVAGSGGTGGKGGATAGGLKLGTFDPAPTPVEKLALTDPETAQLIAQRAKITEKAKSQTAIDPTTGAATVVYDDPAVAAQLEAVERGLQARQQLELAGRLKTASLGTGVGGFTGANPLAIESVAALADNMFPGMGAGETFRSLAGSITAKTDGPVPPQTPSELVREHQQFAMMEAFFPEGTELTAEFMGKAYVDAMEEMGVPNDMALDNWTEYMARQREWEDLPGVDLWIKQLKGELTAGGGAMELKARERNEEAKAAVTAVAGKALGATAKVLTGGSKQDKRAKEIEMLEGRIKDYEKQPPDGWDASTLEVMRKRVAYLKRLGEMEAKNAD